MDRRTLLRSSVAGLLATAGCLGTFDRAGPTDAESAETERATTGSPTGTDGARLRVERVETFTHALRLNDMGTTPLRSVTGFPALADRERDVADAAIDGTYETDGTPDWLVTFLSETPHVERGGTYYRLDHTLPTYAITAEAVPEDEVSGEIATFEAYREAVTHDGAIMTGLMRMAREEGGVEFTSLWPSLRSFLDRYDAVRFHGEVLDFSLSVDDPGAPYAVTATEVTMADVAGRSVWDASEESAAIREVVRAAGAESGVYAFDDPPEGLLEGLDSHDHVYLDGTFYTTYVEKREPLPVSMTAAFEGDGSAARIRLTLRNEDDGTVQVMCGAPRPFGVVRFRPAGDAETSHLLWSDAYEESDHVHTDGRDVVAVNSIGLTANVPAGGEVSRAFSFDWDSIPSGEYTVEDDLGIGVADGDGGTFPFRVVFRVP